MQPIPTRHVRIRPGGLSRVLAAACAPVGGSLVAGGLRVIFSAPQVFLLGLAFSIPTLVYLARSLPSAGREVQGDASLLLLGHRSIRLVDVEAAFESSPSAVTLLMKDRTQIEIELAGGTPEHVLAVLGFDRTTRTLRAP